MDLLALYKTYNVTKRQLRLSQKPIHGQPNLIHPPRNRLLFGIFLRWILLFLLVMLSYSYFWYIALEVYVFFVWFYYILSKMWKLYAYSVLLLHSSTFVVFAIIVATSGTTRQYVIELLYLVIS
jgi:hypothetical protein